MSSIKRSYFIWTWTVLRLTKVLKRKSFKSILVLLGIVTIILLLRWKFMCTNVQPLLHINSVCTSYTNGATSGNLCGVLCQPTLPISCHNYYEKETVFSMPWNNTNIVFKSAKNTNVKLLKMPEDFMNKVTLSENNYSNMIKEVIKSRFNMSLSDIDIKKMMYIHFGSSRVENVLALLQDNEYLALILYERFDIFPKLLGSCGPLYAVEKLNPISGYWHLITLYDSQEEWIKRIKIAIKIIDLLTLLEYGLPEPLLICNVKMNHFGLSQDLKKAMYLDLDSVHPLSVASKLTGDGSRCKRHSDCDFLNCRSFCNLITLRCQHGVVNNNLQIVCEKIFLGWVMSGRVMVPGLLMGSRAPQVLVELLEQCANPAGETGVPRAPASKEIRKKLRDLLVYITY